MPAASVNEDTFLAAVLEHNKVTLSVDWSAVASAVGYKNGAVANTRFASIKKRWGLSKGDAGNGTFTTSARGSGVPKSRARTAAPAQKVRARISHGGPPAGARKRIEAKTTGNGVTGKAKRGVKKVEVEADDDEEVEEVENVDEPRDFIAGSVDRESFESKFIRGAYAESVQDDYAQNDEVGNYYDVDDDAELQRQLDQQMQAEEEYGAYEEEAYDDTLKDGQVVEGVLAGVKIHGAMY